MKHKSQSRVVVWLDPTAPQEKSLPVLACLGSAAEIRGLFVEDMNLIQLSRLPIAREITFEGPTAKLIEQRNIERQFRAHGNRMQVLFETAVRNIGAPYSFQVRRGELYSELLKVSNDCDMLVLSHSRHRFGISRIVRAKLGELLESGPPTLVFVQDRWQTGQRVAALFDGSEQCLAAIRTAASIAASENLNLSIWLTDVADTDRQQLESRIRDILTESAANYSFRVVHTDDIDELVNTANNENLRALVLPCPRPAETRPLISELLDRLNCSVIIAR